METRRVGIRVSTPLRTLLDLARCCNDHRQRADQARDRACGLVGWHVHRYDETATTARDATSRELLARHRRRARDVGRSS